MTACILVGRYQNILFKIYILKMESVYFSETLVNTDYITW
jgi:hypothetical protein